jgi:hypothetical protein
MIGRLPTLQETAQLLRLRDLRMMRAIKRRAAAADEVTAAEIAFHERQQLIHESRSAIDSLAEAVVTSLAPHLPRWNGTIGAHRGCLAERLERHEDAMIDDARRLDTARDADERARNELARARARQEVASDLDHRARLGRVHVLEQRSELETEDQRRLAIPRDGMRP